jgi:hypothetical protein
MGSGADFRRVKGDRAAALRKNFMDEKAMGSMMASVQRMVG